MTQKDPDASKNLSSRLCVVLVNTRNPLNIGAAARAMSNFGFHDLRLVAPYEPSFREARSAMGGSEVLRAAREFASVGEAVADCTLVVGTTSADRRKLEHELKPLHQAAAMIRRSAGHGRVALLFGSEKRGLSNADFSHCYWLLRIPTRPERGSMNLGQAVAVCLYEFSRTRSQKFEHPSTQKKPMQPDHKSLERITVLLLNCLRSSGYIKSTSSEDETIRRMVLRLRLTGGDAELWLGMLRQIEWKLNRR